MIEKARVFMGDFMMDTNAEEEEGYQVMISGNTEWVRHL